MIIWNLKVLEKINKKSLKAVVVMINVYGIYKMELKKEKEKVVIKLKCSKIN